MLLFAEGDTASENAHSRSASLRLVLHTARAIEAAPGPEDVRWHLFDVPADPLPAELEAQRLNWEVYNCQDLMQVAAASLLAWALRSEEHTSELQSLMRISYAVFCLKKKTRHTNTITRRDQLNTSNFSNLKHQV